MTWTRKGECNGCGWCCVYIGQDVSAFKFVGAEADVEFFKVRGFTIFVDETKKPIGATRLCDTHALCPQYEAAPGVESGGRCKIYEHRPITCVDFPSMPEQIRYTPCSYWFEDQNANRIGGQSSPYPVPVPIFKPGG